VSTRGGIKIFKIFTRQKNLPKSCLC
jgi:hypothetical protein